jgi:hypothetical protein
MRAICYAILEAQRGWEATNARFDIIGTFAGIAVPPDHCLQLHYAGCSRSNAAIRARTVAFRPKPKSKGCGVPDILSRKRERS